MSLPVAFARLSSLAASFGNRLRSTISNSSSTSVPNELLALSNEVSDMQIVLDEVETNYLAIIRSPVVVESAEHSNSRILHLIHQAWSILTELNRLILEPVPVDQHSRQVFGRTVWRRKRRLCLNMIQGLRDVKQNMLLVLASQTVYVTCSS